MVEDEGIDGGVGASAAAMRVVAPGAGAGAAAANSDPRGRVVRGGTYAAINNTVSKGCEPGNVRENVAPTRWLASRGGIGGGSSTAAGLTPFTANSRFRRMGRAGIGAAAATSCGGLAIDVTRRQSITSRYGV